MNVHIFELQDILDERFVRFGILGINDEVCAVEVDAADSVGQRSLRSCDLTDD